MSKKYLVPGLIAIVVIGAGAFAANFIIRNKTSESSNLAASAGAVPVTPLPGTQAGTATTNNTPSTLNTTAKTAEPFVGLLSPETNKVYKAGQTTTITWRTMNIPAQAHTIDIRIGLFDKTGTLLAFGNLASGISNSGSATVTLPSTVSGVTGGAFGKNFKILIVVNDSNQNIIASDYSDLFTITAPTAATGSHIAPTAGGGPFAWLTNLFFKHVFDIVVGLFKHRKEIFGN